MGSLATEDGVHTTTALRLHGTPTAVQTQFKRNSKCGCGGMCVVHQAVNWHPWCVGHWILVPHGVPGHTALRLHGTPTAIQTQFKRLNYKYSVAATQFFVWSWCVWLVCGQPRWEYSVLLPPVPCGDYVNTLPCMPPFPNRGSNGRRLS